MADLKISALPASTTPLAGTEVLPIVQSSATKQVSVANLTAGRAVATGALTVTGDATLSTGNLIQGTAAKGINFTANTPAAGMTSQLLNWYEEGAFTPTLTFGGASVGITYGGGTVGKYTRIGRMVFANTHIVLTNKGSSTGTANIASMPFAASVNTAVAFGYVSGMGATISYLEGYISASAIILFKLVAGASSLVTDADFTNATNIQLTIGYEIS
jgi:hypothetical protein